MIPLLFFAFLSGLVTILAPCIWPLLPIILSVSMTSQGHKKPLGISLGIMLSFAFFTLAISALVKLFPFDPNALRLIAVIVIAFLGITMIVPRLSELTEVLVSKLSGLFGQSRTQKGSGFKSGFITGLSLGIVWSPCAGPILAAIAALAATGKVTLDVVLITVAYVIGVGIPLFIFAYGGQAVFTKTRFISSQLRTLQKIFGIIMLLTALAIYTNYDKYIQAQLLNAFPQFSSTLSSFEGSSAIKNQLDLLKGQKSLQISTDDLLNTNTPAPDFVGITKWLNTEKPLSIKDLKGKVVIVDFWTYTCINCIRTLPYVTSWYEKYKDKGFVVIGVHTPEFEFEKDTNNVLSAIKQYNIHYPVPQDNNYATWSNYQNQYWPAEYLIDVSGNIRRVHFGEGEYDKMEAAIQALLKEAGKEVSMPLENIPGQILASRPSPETYLGSARMQYYYPNGNISNGTSNFTLAANPGNDSFSLGGQWTITDENAVTGKDSVLNYNFYANKVFLVLRPGSSGANAKVKVFLDENVVDNSNAGADVQNGVVTIDSDRLYNLIDLKGKASRHILRLEFQTPGIQVFAFTFG